MNLDSSNSRLKLLIADDEVPARNWIKQLIQEIPRDIHVIAEAENGLEVLQYSADKNPDIVLLDIRMPAMDGIDTARELSKFNNPPAVIFITAYDEHALQAFDANAIDYLLKPIRKERFEMALDKARIFNQISWEKLHHELPSVDKTRTHICAQIAGDLCLVPVTDVVYFRADQKYVNLRTVECEILINDSLKALEQEFSSDFIRVHRNTIVSLSYLAGLESGIYGQTQLILRGVRETIEVSRRHLSSIRAVLKKHQ